MLLQWHPCCLGVLCIFKHTLCRENFLAEVVQVKIVRNFLKCWFYRNVYFLHKFVSKRKENMVLWFAGDGLSCVSTHKFSLRSKKRKVPSKIYRSYASDDIRRNDYAICHRLRYTRFGFICSATEKQIRKVLRVTKFTCKNKIFKKWPSIASS